ncbi:MAG: glycosyltransferase family 2 protein [Alicyclobacillus sp.]|nr:glycosyltransferase family 2 protein [Alicyclobacillus sp.]
MRMRIDSRSDSAPNFPLVQVQVVTYNNADTIRSCLQSVFSQRVPVESVLVIDNASADGTPEIVARSGNCELIRLPQNTGYAGGHNVGFRAAYDAGMDYVLTVNPDVVLHPDYLRCLLDDMSGNPCYGGAIGKLIRSRRSRRRGDNLVVDSAGLAMDRFFHVRDRGSGERDGPEYSSPASPWGICGAAALYRVDMLKDIQLPGGEVFDTRLFIYKEDVDLCWRARRRGWVFRYVPDAVADHRRTWVRGTRMPATAASHSFANQVALLIRHVPGWTVHLAATLVVEWLRFIILCGTRPVVAAKALRLILRDWRYHWNCRQWLAERDKVEECTLYDLCRPAHV